MRKFVYLIGSSDDFLNQDYLVEWYQDNKKNPTALMGGLDNDGHYPNVSIYPVTINADVTVSGYDSVEHIAIMIARGEAMSDGWCIDDTFSILIEE